ncbi:MAG: ArsR family transcriptional regulator [Bradyrhizobiaceae bacterium]|nr:MAG: ArsR family transcriptional regulator [Bradyrhizobiaceae bacterium]
MTSTVAKSRANKLTPDQLLAKQAEEVSRLLNVLANENRLLIVCHLMMKNEMKVGELVDALSLSQSALSQHLTKLRDEGLVEFRRESQTLYYRIADSRVTKLVKVLKKLYCDDFS